VRFPSFTSLKLFFPGKKSSVAREFSYNELCAATEYFSASNRIGAGAFGEVFRGVLGGQQVAVKRLTHLTDQTRKDYITEVMTLGKLNHKNLMKLVGWGDDGSNDKLILVYELITNRDLGEHLHVLERLLTWPERYKIVLGISRGIEYLHEGSQNIILHRDIKPSNVMLDDKFEAKLCDFGLVRQVDQGQRSLGTSMIGSIDYMDPVRMGPGAKTVSSASDMYSFGVLLLEVATGREPATTQNHGERVPNGLINDVSDSHAKGTVLDLADKKLNGDFDRDQMERVLAVGLLCVRPNREDRPEIRDAVDLLSNLGRPVPQTVVDGMATLWR
jgi:serine/threonine protein kinase